MDGGGCGCDRRARESRNLALMVDQREWVAALRAGTAAGGWTLDPQASSVQFAVKHFWGAVTVLGQFERVAGEGSVTESGVLTGTLSVDATSLTTKNKQRDKHLRSADFFDIEHHPMVVLTVTEAKPVDGGALLCKGTLEAAGHLEPIEFTANPQDFTDRAVTMTADLVVDRVRFGMTWSPMRIAAYDAHVTVTARFVRA
jgi:polyisoprenoid-binding protein YceI